MRGIITVLTAVLLCGSALGGTPEESHPFTVRDLLAMQRISEPQVSPSGLWIVFTVQTPDLEAGKGRTDLWVVGTNGEGLRQLTTHAEADGGARWLGDSRTVVFLSSRSGSSQVWRIDTAGGEAQQVTDEPLDVGNLIVSRDGKRIGYTMEVFPGLTPEETRKRLDEIKERKASGRIYDRIFVRHWDTWKDGRRSHLFVRDLEGKTAVDVMKDMDADTPSKPFGGPEEMTFTPDGNGVVFTARDAARELEAVSTNFDLYYAPVDGSAAPVNLTQANRAWDTNPVFSPDGKTLAWLAMERPGYESDRLRIVLRDWPNGKARVATQEWDRSVSEFCFAADGRTVFATAPNLGQKSLFQIDLQSGLARTVVAEGSVQSPSLAGNRVVFAMSNLKWPAELFSVRPDGSGFRYITRINADAVSAARMGDYEQFTFNGWNKESVYCYVVKPVDFDPAKKYPVAFLIHGGPQGSFGNSWHYRWNAQTYAGAGYACVMVDFHGSTGYGQAFCDSIRDDWGGKPLVDLQKGLAAALERYPWMDGQRVGALGASYGGYMINWIAGKWPDRFRCLVNHDGSLDERMGYFDTEELWFAEWDHAGTPWENPDSYEKHNPINFVKQWRTPMLVIHGAGDFRVPETHGLATFNALQRRGIPSRLLYFPDENHWVLKPNNSILWHETVIGWLDRWLKD
ncbi:MAG TPA: S9 family peptidase [Anaerohalosphaeraceae bacterium]|jgi:dipeptidyl aminopeptidase/acylaminoacyl peptidase|nr:S9 family peptidase [Anaerohalosphaeraceae bacterium]HRT51270.1 S9 family peptidase [Anaerohalosphaeraceae bacterium]HRT87763.1 S9 family peptidase [Anaerohalosphaeraceae bacterium]